MFVIVFVVVIREVIRHKTMNSLRTGERQTLQHKGTDIINITVCVTSPWNSSRKTRKEYGKQGNQTLAVHHIYLKKC